MQVGGFAWQMAGISYERRDYADCHRLLQGFESLTPLRERSFGDSFLLFRSELARRLGDEDEAIEYAKKSKSKRGRKIAETLADPDRKTRVDQILDVPFIRQYELTCGPATLATISKFWEMSIEHLEVADYPTREGLPAWVMTNVHELLRLTGDEAGGREAIRYAMSLPADHMLSQLALWAAHDCLVQGDPKAAMHEFMKAARMEDLEGTDQLMHLWIESVLHVLASPDKQAALAEIKQRFQSFDLKFNFFKEQPGYRPVFRNSVEQIAASVGTFGAKVWATTQKAKLFWATW